MSTIGSLLALMDPNIKPWSEGMESVNRMQRGQTLNQTELIQLAELKRAQASQALADQYMQQNPEAFFGGGPVLGSLGQPPPGPGGGPMTQTTTIPGQPPGAPQMVPGGQDLSQFATQGAPQSTLASLGPQPQGQAQAPQNPLLEMARRDPRAALLLQHQMQQQEDLQLKRQEQRLTMGTKVMEYLGRGAQGVTDQASLDAFRQDVARVHPQAAAQLPQVYSKEGMAPFIAKALDVQQSLTLQVQTMAAQAELAKARMSGRVAKTDQYLKALGVAPGQETAEDMQKALAWQQQDEIALSASHGTGQVFDTPEGKMRLRPGTNTVEPLYTPGGQQLQPKPTQAETETATFSNLARQGHTGAVALENKGFAPGFWEKTADKLPLQIGNYLTSDDYQKYKDYVMDFAQAWLRRTSKGAITPPEWQFVNERYFPQPGNSKAQIEQKRTAREAVIKELEAEGKATGRTGGQGQPTSQPAPQGPATFDPADFLKWRQGTGKTGNPTAADVQAYFEAKGLHRR